MFSTCKHLCCLPSHANSTNPRPDYLYFIRHGNFDSTANMHRRASETRMEQPCLTCTTRPVTCMSLALRYLPNLTEPMSDIPCRHGDKHTPSIIRMGMNVHHSVASVSMEVLVERRLEASKDSRVSSKFTHASRQSLVLQLGTEMLHNQA